jgi:hypothetical protein
MRYGASVNTIPQVTVAAREPSGLITAYRRAHSGF